MDPTEKQRRLLEKSRRKPVNDTSLDVQNGFIDVNDIFKRIDAKLGIKEEENG
jgi:hypothetical protein